MRIFFDARMVYGNFDGIGRYSLNLLQALAEVDYHNDYTILVRRGFEYTLPKNFRILKYDHYPLSFRTLYLLKQKLSDYKMDIFHSTFLLSPLNLECGTLVTAHDVPWVQPDFSGGQNGAHVVFARHFLQFAMRKSFSNASRIIAVSQNVKNDILKFRLASESKLKVLYPAVDFFLNKLVNEELSDTVKFSEEPIILTVGKTRPQKNWLRLIKSFKIFREQMRKGTLILVSSDDRNLNSINSLIRELDFNSEIVKVLGYHTQNKLKELYHSSDMFIFPSLYEGFGMPPLEAMACGVPVIASNRGALPEVLGEAAFYVNPEDEKDIAGGMQIVLQDAKLRKSLIEKGYQQVKKYSWENTATQILKLYNEVYRESKR